ncbi:MAG TPA: HPP family protein [Clostridia bacterium]
MYLGKNYISKESYLSYLRHLKNKFMGTQIKTHILQCIGIFIALLLLVKAGELLHEKLLIAPFGASCVILFGFPESHFSAPKRIIGGYFICSLTGVAIHSFFGNTSFGVAFAVSLAVLVMLLTNLMHPPSGAVTIIAVTADYGWTFVLTPVVVGAFIVIVIAVIYNKLHKKIGESIKGDYPVIISEMEESE